MHLSNCQPDSHKPALASNRQRRGSLFAATVAMVASLVASTAAVPAGTEPATPSVSAGSTSGLQLAADPTGIIATLDVTGPVDESGAFFQSLGTNGRSCATCHVAAQAMGLSVKDAQARFAATAGQDPLFAPVDGANCPSGRPGSAADHSLLLRHGLIRIFLPVPANAQFTVSVVYDPYGCAMVPGPNGGAPIVSVYRRPLPTTNLHFLSTIMFDGRETHAPLNNGQTFAANLTADLTQQALDAITIHAQASEAPTSSQLADIVGFELGLFSAQTRDEHAGSLRVDGALGGARNLAAQTYYPGINDTLGGDPSGAAFNPVAMTLFSAWLNLSGDRDDPGEANRDAARRAIAAGEQLFDSTPVHITNVRGLNDNAALGKPDTLTGTCTTCHDTPNVGNHSFPLPLDIGTSHSLLPGAESDPKIAAALAELSLPTVPVYLINGCPNPFNPGEPESFYTTDPGKALVSGLCSDFNRGKGPVLRGLAARAPYFHNGTAADLRELVNFYNQRFQMGLTEEQKHDLIAFLNSL
jgi:cytochrome c peroxidase